MEIFFSGNITSLLRMFAGICLECQCGVPQLRVPFNARVILVLVVLCAVGSEQ